MSSRDIVIGNRKMTVRVLRVRDSGKVEAKRQDAAKTPSDDLDIQVIREFIYPVLWGCTSGDVPTEEEFLDMPAVEAGIWYDAVDEINPGLLIKADLVDEKKES